MEAAHTFAPGDVIDGRYKIVSLLGEGGMGAVYVVEHVHMKKRMALKVLHASMQSPELLARFEREAMAAAHIDHPNVASATDFGHTKDGALFMVMEYIDGRSLRDVLEEAGPLPEPRALVIARQIAGALAKAHELGIVHRDLKPENVMLVVKDGLEHVKVLDFGIAKVQLDQITGSAPGQALTQIGAVFGTPEYMAPEQAQGQPVDARADLYSLGIMLYEMLAGVRPFEAQDHVQLLVMHVTEPPAPLRARNPAVSPAAEALVMGLLEKQPDARPRSARDVVQAIDAALGETPAPVSMSALVSKPVSTRSLASSGGLAKTQLPDTAPPSMRLVQKLPTPVRRLALDRLPPAIRALPRSALVAIAAALVAVPVALAVLVVALHRGGTTPAASASASNRAPEIEANKAPEAELARAREGGSAALIQLWARFPRDARIGRATVSAYAAEKRWGDACNALTRLVDVDPSAAGDPEMQRIVQTAVIEGTSKDVDAAIDAMTGALGSEGVDMLLDLQGRSGLAAATRSRISDALARPETRAHASKAASILLDLKAAKRCEDRRALLERARADGDARVLAILKPMQQTSGCGFLRMRDCWPCMRKDSALDDTISALEAKR